MATLTAFPQGDLSADLSRVKVPVDYSSPEGLALALAFSAVSSRKVQPQTRLITSAQFRSGSYNFPVPFNYQASAYKLPMLEPASWTVSSDTLNAYSTVEVYQIGSSSDPMTATFPIQINTTQIAVPGGNLSPLGLNQSVVLIIYKNPNVRIEWALSNIVNNGMLEEVIKAQSWLAFEVTNIGGTFRVTRWINPAIMYPAPGGDLSSLYPTPTIANNAITSAKIYAGAVTQTKIASGAVGTDQLATGAVTTNKLGLLAVGSANLAANSVTPSKLSANLQASIAYIPIFTSLTNKSPFYTGQSDYSWISGVDYTQDSGLHKWTITPKAGVALYGLQGTLNILTAGMLAVDETLSSGKITVIIDDNTSTTTLTKYATINAYTKP